LLPIGMRTASLLSATDCTAVGHLPAGIAAKAQVSGKKSRFCGPFRIVGGFATSHNL
jgi:hypothetical protein